MGELYQSRCHLTKKAAGSCLKEHSLWKLTVAAAKDIHFAAKGCRMRPTNETCLLLR